MKTFIDYLIVIMFIMFNLISIAAMMVAVFTVANGEMFTTLSAIGICLTSFSLAVIIAKKFEV